MSDHSQDPFAPSTTDPLVGQVIQDRYRVVKKLGQGGMGAVYLAEHILIKKQVAIKCLHAGLASNADVVRRFHNEAVAATAIGHPNIVDVTDMGRFDDGTFFMALEFLSGRDWQDDLDKTGAQPLSKVAHIGAQICDALEAASAKGIVHRDLKPENIFLIERHGDSEFVKVLDFGISKFHDGIGGSTKTGELMGTPYYMAPEQIRGDRDISHVADIYALGVIFFQALSGDVPFDGNTLPELILKIASQEAPRLDERVGNLPPDIVDLVHAMLSKSPHDRPQTFLQVAEALLPYVPDASRLSIASHQHAQFASTSVGGSLDEPTLGNPIPERPRQATPVASRGPDTAAGGTPGFFGRTELPQAAPDHGSTTSPHSITNAGASSAAATAETPKPGSNKVAFIALAVAAAAGIGWFATRPQAPKEESAPPSAAENGDLVRVQISTIPPDAELYLDGEPISNPFDGELEKDKKTHELIVKREGFQETKRTMVLNSAQRIFVPMTSAEPPKAEEPAPPAPAPVSKGPIKTVAPRPTPAPAAAPAPEPAPAAAPAPAPAPAPTPKPASDLRKIF